MTKRDIGSRITQVGRGITKRNRTHASLQKRIARYQAKATKLREEMKELDAACLAELGVHADVIADFSIDNWDSLVEKGTRLIRYGTGEFRLRDIGRPTIEVADKEAFFREARRKGVARKVIRHSEEPDLEALRDNLELADRMRTVSVIFTTKMEIRPRHVDERLESVYGERSWSIVEPKGKK